MHDVVWLMNDEPGPRHGRDQIAIDLGEKGPTEGNPRFAAQSDIGSVQRPYWAAARESFIHLGTRLARELGAGFKIIGQTAYMWPRNTPLFGAGDTGGVITAEWGVNLLDWDIAPDESRPRFSQARACWYDPKAAKWMDVLQAIGLPGASAALVPRS